MKLKFFNATFWASNLNALIVIMQPSEDQFSTLSTKTWWSVLAISNSFRFNVLVGILQSELISVRHSICWTGGSFCRFWLNLVFTPNFVIGSILFSCLLIFLFQSMGFFVLPKTCSTEAYISNLVSKGELIPIASPTSFQTPSHVLYANDIIIFCRGKKRNARNIISFLNLCAEASGNKVNKEKPNFFSGCISQNPIFVLSSLLGFRHSSLPFIYFGVPLFVWRWVEEDSLTTNYRQHHI